MNINDIKNEKDAAAIIVDEDGIITEVNKAFEHLFGWSTEECIGEAMTLIIPPDLRDAHNIGFSRFIQTGQGSIMEQPLNLKACNKAGDIFDAEHYLLGEKIDGKWVIGATIKPYA